MSCKNRIDMPMSRPLPEVVPGFSIQGVTPSILRMKGRLSSNLERALWDLLTGRLNSIPAASIAMSPAYYDVPVSNMPAASSSRTDVRGDPDHFVQCERCGKKLFGPYADGNLTRHQKSKTCQSSSGPRTYPCNEAGCNKVYHRSDALLTHRRKAHGAPGPLRKGSAMGGS